MRVDEKQVTAAVIAFLNDKSGRREASLRDLTFYLPGKYLRLSPADREMQRHRNEQKWHAVLRNIGAHAGQPGNAITEGRLMKRKGGGYALPVIGQKLPTAPAAASTDGHRAPSNTRRVT